MNLYRCYSIRDLRPLSDTIENMERTKLQIEQLERNSQALGSLCRHYDVYNDLMVLSENSELIQKTKQRLIGWTGSRTS